MKLKFWLVFFWVFASLPQPALAIILTGGPGIQDEFQNQVNPSNGSDTSAKGILVWKKEDFLNGAATQPVSLVSGGTLSCTVTALSGTSEIRFVVKQGGDYYVSKASTSGVGSFSSTPTATNWAPISTVDYSIGAYAPISVTDIEAAGLYYSTERSGSQSLLKISAFSLEVPTGAISGSPSHYEIEIIPSESGDMATFWKSEFAKTYRLQRSETLEAGSWENIGEPVVGSGDFVSITNLPLVETGFYRIITE